MKRRVKAWILSCATSSDPWMVKVYDSRQAARDDAWKGQRIIPCTIEYDDGKAKPKQRKK